MDSDWYWFYEQKTERLNEGERKIYLGDTGSKRKIQYKLRLVRIDGKWEHSIEKGNRRVVKEESSTLRIKWWKR